jgi:hypothetical protein
MNQKEWQPIQELFAGTWIALSMVIAELAGAGTLDLQEWNEYSARPRQTPPTDAAFLWVRSLSC